MVKIWAKLIKEQRIIKSEIVEIDDYYHSSKLFEYVVLVCYQLDIPTPAIIKSHKFNFTNFNLTKFRPSDFLEYVDFDMLTIEHIVDK
ncbi:MAG: hypothetical protein LBU60_04930 [Clostridiales bacterium]|jgi:hypothetical protein|nr:hypothetical protein [Clostridiales bacterium]